MLCNQCSFTGWYAIKNVCRYLLLFWFCRFFQTYFECVRKSTKKIKKCWFIAVFIAKYSFSNIQMCFHTAFPFAMNVWKLTQMETPRDYSNRLLSLFVFDFNGIECKFYDKLSVEFDLHFINTTVSVWLPNGIIMKKISINYYDFL